MAHLTDARLEAFVIAFFAAWERCGIEYLILRNYSELPHRVGNDLDVLVRSNQQGKAEDLLVTTASSCGFTLVNRAEFSPVSLFFAELTSGEQIHVDLFKSLKWRGFDIMEPNRLLAARNELRYFPIPDPVHEATINLLTGLLYHGQVKNRYRPGILDAYTNEPDDACMILTPTLGERAANRLVRLTLAEEWNAIEADATRWRQSVISHQFTTLPCRTMRSLALDARRLIMRAKSPPGIMMVLLGPDGSGKSSVAAGLMEKLAPTFAKAKGAYVHWKPPLTRQRGEKSVPTTNPHDLPPRRRLASLAFFYYHWLGFTITCRLKFLPVLFRNGLIIVDRYYHDILVDPRRYRLDVPRHVILRGQDIVMNPDLIICLDAPLEVLRARKEEVVPEETERQRQEYVELVRNLPNGRVVDAAQPLTGVVTEVERIIFDYLATRTAARPRPTRF